MSEREAGECPIKNYLNKPCTGSFNDVTNCDAYEFARNGGIEKVVNSGKYEGCPFLPEIKRFNDNFIKGNHKRFDKNADSGSATIPNK